MTRAARVGDPGAPPHNGEVGKPGSTNVLIGGQGAARMSDLYRCALPPSAGPHFPNSITTGSASVMINFMPAARMGDSTACGGTILTGCPTVMIGGPTFGNIRARLGNITIQGSPAFIGRVEADLAVLAATPDGAALLARLTDVTIVEFLGDNSFALPTDYHRGYSGSVFNGSGSSAVVGYNPHLTLQVNIARGEHAPTPPPLVLGHELIHAMHMNEGATELDDESATIGYGSHATDSPTENSLRGQMATGLGQRIDHGGVVGRTPGVPPGPVR